MEWLRNPDWIIAVAEAIVPLVAVVFWLARLESKVREHSKELDKMEEKSETLFNKLFDKLSSIEVSIAKVEGKLSTTEKP